MIGKKEYVDKKISALECEVLEKVLQVIAGSIPEKPLGQVKGAEPGEEIPGLLEKNSGTEEKEEPDIFSDPVIMAAAQKWG